MINPMLLALSLLADVRPLEVELKCDIIIYLRYTLNKKIVILLK